MRIALAVVGLALLTYQPAAWATGPHDLKNRFNDGETVYLNLMTQIQGMSQVRDQFEPEPLESTIHSVVSFYTRLINPDGSANIDVELELINMISPTMGIREPMDLKEAVMHPDDLRLEMAIQPSGQVRDNPVTSSSSQPFPGLDNLNNSPMELRPYPLLPEAPALIGERWTESWVIPFDGASKPVIGHATYTLHRVEDTEEGRIAHIRTQTSVLVDNVAFEPLSPRDDIQEHTQIGMRYREYRVEGTGDLTFNMDKGRATLYEDDKRIHMDLDTITVIEGEPIASEVKLIYRMRSRAQYTDTPPVAPGLDLYDPWR